MKTKKKTHKGGTGGAAAKLMLLPSVFLLALTSIYPFAWMFRYVLTDYNGFTANFTGSRNFTRMLGDKLFWSSVLHTLEYAGLKLLFILPPALILAVLANQKIKGSGLFRGIYFMPTVISPAIYSLIFGFIFAVYNGALNSILQGIGLVNKPVDWLGNPSVVMYAIIIVAVWGGLGNYMIWFLSGMSGISSDVYESAAIDGANAPQTFFRITLPMLSPILKVVIMLAITSAFKDYESIMVLTQGGPSGRSQVMFLYIYQLIFGGSGAGNALPQMGYATLLSVVAALIIGAVTALYLFLARKLDDVV